jgi:hypothetical protein
MISFSRALVVGAIAWVGFARPVWSQACASATDSVAVHLRVQVRTLSGSTEAEYAAARRDFLLPSVDSTTIVAVTQTQTCQKVLDTFNASVPGISPVPTRIYAVKVGTAYVAVYPTPDTHVWPMVVMDSKFKVLSKFAM